MTCDEFSNEFDNLLNSYAKINTFGNTKVINSIELDEYEKSLFLTQAQEELIQEFYTGKNPFYESYEKTEEIRRYLTTLVKSYNSTIPDATGPINITPKSTFYKLPTDVWFIVHEAVSFNDPNLVCDTGNVIEVKPVTHDNYNYFSKNPFKKPSNSKVFRLDINSDLVEIVSQYIIGGYTVRYISKPSPIILVDLGELTINNINTKTECELNSALHRAILKRAVDIALRRFNVANN